MLGGASGRRGAVSGVGRPGGRCVVKGVESTEGRWCVARGASALPEVLKGNGGVL